MYIAPRAPNPRRVQMFMAEKNITNIALVNVDLNQGEHRDAAFLAKSPQAKVPALELDDGRVLTETRAICTYLEGLYPEPNLMGHDFDEKAFIEMADRRAEWTLLLGAANAIRHTHPGLAALEHPQFPAFGQSQFEKLKENAKVFDSILQTHTWMAGPRFTIADITAFCTLKFARGLLKFSPAQEGLHALQAWRDRVNERDSARA
ncbi:MAG: glutathione S-transferase family protein [Sulfuritalea sp.]|nr:glutathione S-transferase family protein [Sulfuritalea sp.]